MRNPLRRVDTVPAVVVVAVITACVVQYLSGGPVRGIAFDTDALNIPTVVADLVSHHGSLSNWWLSPAPYLYPDALLFVPAHLLGSTAYVRIVTYMALQLAALWWALLWTARRAGHQRPQRFAAVTVAVLAWAGINSTAPFNQLFVAGFHAGGFIASLFLVGLCIGSAEDHAFTRRAYELGTISALTFMLVLSDSIVLVQTVAPLVVLLLLMAACGSRRRMRHVWTAGVLAVAAAAGHVAYPHLVAHPTRYPLVLTGEKISSNFAAVRGLVSGYLGDHTAALPVLLVFAVVACVATIRVVRRLQRNRSVENLVVWCALSVVTTVAGVGLATTNEVTIRYFLPVVVLPLVGILLVATSPHSVTGGLSVLAALACTVAVVSGAVRLTRDNGMQLSFRPAEITCIDDAISSIDGRHGIAQYWDAKYVQSLSGLDITLAQYMDNLLPMRWITTDSYFTGAYDFAIVTKAPPSPWVLSVDLITAGNGQPLRTVDCPGHLVLLYGHGKLRIK